MTTQVDKATAKIDKQLSLEPKPAAALATVTPIEKALAKYTEKDLDKTVEKIHSLKGKAAEDYWYLGAEIKDLLGKQLWKLRTEDGKPKYKTADAFCLAELGMTPQQARKCSATAEAFTVEQTKAFGTKKLGLILEAPEEDRPALQKAVEAGATRRQLEEEVRKKNKGRKTIQRKGKEVRKPGAGGVTDKGEKAKRPGPKPKSGKTITVANITGVQTIILYKKGTQIGEDKKQWTRAKRIADQPTASVELENAVVQTYTVTDGPEGFLKLRIETRRIDA